MSDEKITATPAPGSVYDIVQTMGMCERCGWLLELTRGSVWLHQVSHEPECPRVAEKYPGPAGSLSRTD